MAMTTPGMAGIRLPISGPNLKHATWHTGYFRPMKRLLLVLAVAAASLVHGQTSRVLFIGNSYVGVNNLPDMTRQLALSLGHTLEVASSNPGGYTFQQHTGNTTTRGLIAEGNWDFVVLQEQSQLPSFPPSQVASQCLPYAAALVDSIRTYSPCADAVFYMTWGRQDGDQQNCPGWPPVCTYEGMQARLRESYLLMAMNNDAECAPAGAAWKRIREEHPTINLYSSDGSHPSVAGSYLVACTMYSTFFRKSTVGATWHSTLDAATAAILQQVASSTVLDSLGTWKIGVLDPVALPQHADLGGGQVSFSEASVNATQHFWNLGDGTTSTGSSFTHTYANSGSYTITYITSDDCGRADTSMFSLNVTATGISENAVEGFSLHQEVNGWRLSNPGSAGILELYDLQGRLLQSISVVAQSSGTIRQPEAPVVLWRFSSGDGVRTGKVVR